MAGGSLLALLDDITLILDDVSAMTKVSAQKTAGVLGDDLALNAQQVSGVTADRELPVVWAVAKGSLLNKTILVPLALLLGYFAPFLVTPLLMVGGAYLCFEGFEKVAHTVVKNRRKDEAHREALIEALTNENVDMVAFEKDKVKGAVRTDFVLSAEIIAITLGVLQANQAPFLNQVLVLVAVAVLITVFVYGLVAVIVKLDDVGFYLRGKTSQFAQKMGAFLLWVTPHLMR
jgi:predicted DNA repair protein MutK